MIIYGALPFKRNNSLQLQFIGSEPIIDLLSHSLPPSRLHEYARNQILVNANINLPAAGHHA